MNVYPEVWFFVLRVERVEDSHRTRWYWMRFREEEERSALFDTFEACIADARRTGFALTSAYHVISEADAGPRLMH